VHAGALKLSGEEPLRDAMFRFSLGALVVLFFLWMSSGFEFRGGRVVEL
jgi:hypothetical protein